MKSSLRSMLVVWAKSTASANASLRRDVAIKLLPATFSRDFDCLCGFTQEAQSTAALNHPNIVSIYQIGGHEGGPFILSELLEGQTLRQVVHVGPLSAHRPPTLALRSRAAWPRPECRDLMDPFVAVADVAQAALPPCGHSCALVCANILLAAGLRLAKRAAFLWAALPLLAIGVVEKIAFNTSHFGFMLASRMRGSSAGAAFSATGVPMDPLTHLPPGQFLISSGLWVGLAVAAAFLAAVVRLRRNREPI